MSTTSPVTAPTPAAAARRPDRLPDLAIGFSGNVTGYGHLARALVQLDRVLGSLGPLSEFRCHRGPRRLTLTGDVPVTEAPAALAGLARVGSALGMRVACTVRLPQRADAYRGLPALVRVGGLTTLVLDLTHASPATGPAMSESVSAALHTAETHGLAVELRGPVPVLLASGALRAAWLDAQGVTIRPGTTHTAERDRSIAELFFTVDGDWYADEQAWRRGDVPVGSVHDEPQGLLATLHGVLPHGPATRPHAQEEPRR